ncbi:MAG: MBL fold hydrolase [Treponema sp. GWB1_62_6]|nr:MAG: MBL fold hydrolase [Treponema sp. GWA1_62_8]OHE66922.1 MAG: MBL fold hydrolase [Treponema sp. GWC1_61_84]OHE70214.1 MAG: MBL fold hydrolase [Treponema sp. GWB1_62_6]OHE76370.1 MAG: MBL fold hydrolase [Treponema sp. RIFOXYC1_FULL_61_9]HCM25531.1 MBL fold hydrolase [Treponema sp.]
MKLFFYYCLYGFSNCYLIGEDEEPAGGGKRRALIVDPGSMDEKIVGFIEDNDYDLRAVLVTHDHMNHVHGLRTLKRIYDVEVFAGDPTVCEERATLVKDGDRLELGSFAVDVFSVPGHSSDSVVYRIDRLLFSGDALTAGLVGTTASAYGRSVQSAAIRSKILSLPGDYTVLPGHGPPTTLETERRHNAGLEAAEKAGAQRAAFVRDIW